MTASVKGNVSLSCGLQEVVFLDNKKSEKVEKWGNNERITWNHFLETKAVFRVFKDKSIATSLGFIFF